MEQIYLRDFFLVLWRAKWWIVICVSAGLTIAYEIVKSTPAQFEVSMTLVPAASDEQQTQTANTGLVGELTGQMLGLPPGRGAPSVQLFLQMFISPVMIGQLRDMEVLPRLFPQFWDADRSAWVEPTGWRHWLVVALRGPNYAWKPPTDADASDLLSQKMEIEAGVPRAPSVVRISYTCDDAQFGVQLINSLYGKTDDYLRKRARAENNDHIKYILGALANERDLETRQSLVALLNSEQSRRVMINSDAPYAMEVLEPPSVLPARPTIGPAVFALLAVGIGTGLGIVLYLLTSALLNAVQRPARRRPASGLRPDAAPAE